MLIDEALRYFKTKKRMGEYLGISPHTITVWGMGNGMVPAKYREACNEFSGGMLKFDHIPKIDELLRHFESINACAFALGVPVHKINNWIAKDNIPESYHKKINDMMNTAEGKKHDEKYKVMPSLVIKYKDESYKVRSISVGEHRITVSCEDKIMPEKIINFFI